MACNIVMPRRGMTVNDNTTIPGPRPDYPNMEKSPMNLKPNDLFII